MEYRYANFALFFSGLLFISYLIFPGQFDMVAMYRNSYLYNQALDLLDRLETQRPTDTRIDLERANVLYLAGRYDDAIALLTEVTAREPRNETAWRQLARGYRVLQRPRDAMVAFERVAEIVPRDSTALHLLDEYYRWFQLPDREALNLERLAQRFPDNRSFMERLYELHLRTGRIEQAILLLEKMAARFEDKLDLELTMGQLLTQLGDPRAIEVLGKAYADHPDRSDIADDLVEAYLRSGEAERAADVYRTHYSVRLSRMALLDGLAGIYWSAGQPLQAAEVLARKLEVSSTEDVRMEVASAYEDAGAAEVALPHARALVEANPANRDHHTRLIRILETLALRLDLVAALERYVGLWPNEAGGLLRLADARSWSEDYQGEAQALEAYLRLRPADRGVEMRLADAYLATGMVQEALPRVRRMMRNRGQDAAVRDRFYGLLTAAGPSGASIADAELLSRNSGSTDAERNALFLADTYLARGARTRAVTEYAALAKSATSPSFRAVVARRLLDTGEADLASGLFKAVLSESPDLVAAHEGLADAFTSRDPKAALFHLERAEALEPGRPETAYRFGVIHEAAQDSVSAIRAYKGFLALTAEAPADGAYAFRQRAHAFYRTGSSERALAVLGEARRAFPGDPEVVNDAAAILIDQKRYDEAMSLLEPQGKGGGQ